MKLRYQPPSGGASILLENVAKTEARELAQTSQAYRFSAAVACFGAALRHSELMHGATLPLARSLAEGALDSDPRGYQREFLSLVQKAQTLGL